MAYNASPVGLSGQQPQFRSFSSNNPFRNRAATSTATNGAPRGTPESPLYTTPATAFPAQPTGYFAQPAAPVPAPVSVTFAAPAPVVPKLINPFPQPPTAQTPSPMLTATPSPSVGPLQQTLAAPQPYPSPRPMSTNPFLSDGESVAFNAFIERQQQVTPQAQYQTQQQQQPLQRQQGGIAELDDFQSLTLSDNTQPPRAPRARPPPPQSQPPPHAAPNNSRLLHQRTLGDLKQANAAPAQPSAKEDLLIDIFADPEPTTVAAAAAPPPVFTTHANNRQPPFAPTFSSSSGASRPRRNSDTSVMERERAPQKFDRMNAEDERRRRAHERDRRYREMSHKANDKEHAHQYRERKEGKDADRVRSERHRRHEGERGERGPREKGDEKRERRGKTAKPNRKLDVIDKLDLTGIYGPGQFHHDGPFDACNPHRNRKGIRAAPMQAFAEDSPSMVPTGGGPRPFDHDLYLGKGEDPYNDFSRTAIRQAVHVNNSQAKPDVATYDPKGKIEPVHGEETMGLGTSTFLDGAPASRAAIQEKQRGRSIDDSYLGLRNGHDSPAPAAGLARKKSLAQRMKLGGHSHNREKTMSDRPLRVSSPDQADDGAARRKGSLPNGYKGSSGSGSPGGAHGHHGTSASYDSYDRASFDREGKNGARAKTIEHAYATDGDEVDDFGRPILGEQGPDWIAGHGARYGSGSGSGSGSGVGFLGRMKSLRKR